VENNAKIYAAKKPNRNLSCHTKGRQYDRRGHLFQDRFKSEAIEDDRHLLAVLRYIHQRKTEEKVMEYAEESRITDAEGKALVDKISGCGNAEEFFKIR